MNRIRWVLATWVLASMMAVVGAHTVGAQDATPISVPTPTATGCDQLAPYVEARQKIMDEMIAGIAAIFPDVATPVIGHGDELAVAMLAMSPEQTGQLAELYAATADKIEKLDVPEIAQFYNQQIVELYRLSSKTFDEAKTSDLMTAGQKYGIQLSAIATAVGTYGTSAAGICPAFADVLKVDQTQVGV